MHNLLVKFFKWVEQYIDSRYWRIFYFLPGNKYLYHDSKRFCIAPWIQLHAQTNGKAAPCCMANMSNGNEIGDLNQDADLLNSWNSEKMKQLRKNMLQGKESEICSNCYNYEKHGKFSERMTYNRDFKRYAHRLIATEKDGYLPMTEIPLIDLRFTNKCNYKCRICSSEYSSLWHEEELKIGRLDNQEPIKELFLTNDAGPFSKSLEGQLKTVKRLHFAGGEPLFMDEHYQTLEKLIELGNFDVILSYNTNFSTLRYKKYDLITMWQKFSRVDVWASLDGMGEKGDYQRKGQKWSKIEANIRAIQKDCPSVLFGVNVTVSVFNVLDVVDFYKYMIENKLVATDRMNLYLLFGPECFSITQLPEAIKQQAAAIFDDFEKNYLPSVPNNANISNHIKSVRSYMFSEQGNLQETLRKRILEVDALREEKFEEVFPELKGLISNTLVV